jgi:hypothetical protein
MDFAFGILLPEDAVIRDLQFSVPTREWDGQFYPQGPEEVIFDRFRLVRRDMEPYFIFLIDRLPANLKSFSWKSITIAEGLGEVMDEAWCAGRKLDEDHKLFELTDLILRDQSEWVLIVEVNYDDGIEVLSGDISLVREKLIKASDRCRDGFMIWYSAELKMRQ